MNLHPTPCSTCDNVTAQSRKHSSYMWTCIRFPRLHNLSPIDPTGLASEPYNFCRNVNLGYCPVWAPRRDGQKDNGL